MKKIFIIFSFFLANFLNAQKTVIDVLVSKNEYSNYYKTLKQSDKVSQLHNANNVTLFIFENKFSEAFKDININKFIALEKIDLITLEKIVTKKSKLLSLSGRIIEVTKKKGQYFLQFDSNLFARLKPVNSNPDNGYVYELTPIIKK